MIRKAKISDAKNIHKLINNSAKDYQIIPRSLNEIYENIRDYFVYELEGKVAGVCALHILWEDLAEIKSLSVKKKQRGQGIGRSLVKRAVKEGRALEVKKVFALTYLPGFFNALGFKDIDKSKLPHKIWGECIKCPKFPDCDESGVIINLA